MSVPPTSVPRQLPNAITIARILVAPIFLWMLLADAGADGALRWWAGVLFAVAIATDGLDGYIARRYEVVSDLGKLLDPIADKALTGCAFVCTLPTSGSWEPANSKPKLRGHSEQERSYCERCR